MTRNRLGTLQRDILHSLPRDQQESRRGSLTVTQIRLKIKPDSPNVHSTEQSIRRALRKLETLGHVDKSGNWADLHSESWQWKLTNQTAQLVRLEKRIAHGYATRGSNRRAAG